MKKAWNIILVLGFFGCNQKVVSYVNPNARFDNYETYRLVSPKIDRTQIDGEASRIFTIIKESIAEQMSRRDYVQSSVTPDLTLRYEVTSGTRTQTTTQRSLYWPVYQINTQTIHESILLLELLDENEKLVWQGSYDLGQERREQKLKLMLQNSVARIFTTYPYKARDKNVYPELTTFEKKKKVKK
ncbi:MAG: hypothetical protein Tsb0034_24010 [Ekhidna sp.]